MPKILAIAFAVLSQVLFAEETFAEARDTASNSLTVNTESVASDCCTSDSTDFDLDCSVLSAASHPRLFLKDEDFRSIRKSLKSNRYLASFHKLIIGVADDAVDNGAPLEYKMDKRGRSILKTSQEAVRKISALAYAYRFTKNKLYLRKAEHYLREVCSFPDWNPSHFLDPSEMAFAVAVGYDWLYDSLSEDTRSMAARCLRDFAMEEVAHGIGQQIYDRSGNWNQVCIAGTTAAAIVTCELNPELSSEVIRRGIASNCRAVSEIYYPSGAFPEGPGYWEYGTCYQCWLCMMLEDNFGSDFGLSDVEGFDRTGVYKAFSRSGAGHAFNYSDNTDNVTASPGMWYLAWRFGQPGILYNELNLLNQGTSYSKDRRLLLALISAYRLGKVDIAPMKERIYVGTGTNDVLMAAAGWDRNSLYLGLKGGCASVGHSHMDAGSFVFDAYGTRWANDYYVRAYDSQELLFRQLGLDKSEWAYDQKSYRWYLFQYNNRQHSTLTVNGKDHNVDGFASLVETWDEPDRLGGKLDMTAVFGGDLKTAYRSAAIRDNSYLEIVDELETADAAPAHVRFTIISKVKPKIEDGGIVFNDGKTKMVLSTDAAGAEYMLWSSDPKDYDSPTAFGEPPFKKTWICGYEYDIPASSSAKVTTTLSKR